MKPILSHVHKRRFSPVHQCMSTTVKYFTLPVDGNNIKSLGVLVCGHSCAMNSSPVPVTSSQTPPANQIGSSLESPISGLYEPVKFIFKWTDSIQVHFIFFTFMGIKVLIYRTLFFFSLNKKNIIEYVRQMLSNDWLVVILTCINFTPSTITFHPKTFTILYNCCILAKPKNIKRARIIFSFFCNRFELNIFQEGLGWVFSWQMVSLRLGENVNRTWCKTYNTFAWCKTYNTICKISLHCSYFQFNR